MAKKKLAVRLILTEKDRRKKLMEIEKLEDEVKEYHNLSREFLRNLFNQDDFKQYLIEKYGNDLNIDAIVTNIIDSVALQIVERIRPIPKIPSSNFLK